MGAMAGNPDEEVPEIEEETSRLAVLDLDWTKVKSPLCLACPRVFKIASCCDWAQDNNPVR